ASGACDSKEPKVLLDGLHARKLFSKPPLRDEATKVTTFLQRRGHNPDEACAVMGVALARLIDNRGMLESFIDALRAEYRVVRGLVRLAAMLLTLSGST